MIKHGWVVGLLVSAASAAFACSSGGSGNSLTSCLASSNGSSSACTSCMESNCSSEINSFENVCNAYLNCVCQGGTYSQSAAVSSTCQGKLTTACTNASGSNNGISMCQQQHCASQCSSTSSGSGGGSGSGSGSGSSSSGSGGSGNVTTSCYFSTGPICTASQIPSSSLSTVQGACTMAGGTVGTACPTASVVGCCKMGTSETCYYSASLGSIEKMQCGADGGSGTWSTTP